MCCATSIQDLITEATAQCQKYNISNYSFAAFTILEWCAGKTKLDYLIEPKQIIKQAQAQKFKNAINQLINGKPLYRIIGERNFFGLDLTLNADTLEPRFDTEIVVELAIKHIKNILATIKEIHFLDIGVGSGAISLALLNYYRNYAIKATGVDISQNCIIASEFNSKKYNLAHKLKLIQSDLFSYVTDSFDLIISNPPYIPRSEINNLDDIVKNHDPLTALDGGNDGLLFYRKIAAQSCCHLNKNGLIIVEIGSTQKNDVIAIFNETGYELIDSSLDYNKLDRGLVFKRIRY